MALAMALPCLNRVKSRTFRRLRVYAMGTWSFFLAIVLASLFSSAAEPGFRELIVDSPLYLTSANCSSFEENRSKAYCARLRVLGHSKQMLDFAKSRIIKLEEVNATYFPTIKGACAVWGGNDSDICRCPYGNLTPAKNRSLWTGRYTTVESYFLDIKLAESRNLVRVTATEVVAWSEFHTPRVVFLILGMALLLLSTILSSWVPLYYTSAMSISIFFVVFFIFQQATRRSGTAFLWSFRSIRTIYGGAFFLFILRYEIFEGMWRAVFLFSILGVFLFGAWLGYCAVRKFVLTPDGEVDIGTVYFVTWAIRMAGTVALSQSAPLPMVIPIIPLGWLASWFADIMFTTAGITGRNQPAGHGADHERPRTPRGRQDGRSPGSGRSPESSRGRSVTPTGSPSTNEALKRLLASPEFAAWAKAGSPTSETNTQPEKEEQEEEQATAGLLGKLGSTRRRLI
ncbi:hypothetical protein SELMODRAFT_417845 [Selaginella moellendorffii]|uniref:Uncharacterized protein n=1 Tax=Selaginella moellendorffii TaxID=88036 RepID=D8S3U3_SELML|nr:hypothetical protein SELMODRAFT_417845 [Selaginella moellendorffii]